MHFYHFLDGPKLKNSSDDIQSMLLSKDRFHVKVAQPSGLMFVGGVSNSYSLEYSNEINLSAVISDDELTLIIRQFNDSITSFWPCTAIYACGCLMAPFTLGFSLFAPNYCISQAEEAGIRCLEQVSLRSSYYHRDIKFELKKTWMCSSYIEVSFPSKLLVPEESGLMGESDDLTRRVPSGVAVTVAPGALSSSPARQPRKGR